MSMLIDINLDKIGEKLKPIKKNKNKYHNVLFLMILNGWLRDLKNLIKKSCCIHQTYIEFINICLTNNKSFCIQIY